MESLSIVSGTCVNNILCSSSSTEGFDVFIIGICILKNLGCFSSIYDRRSSLIFRKLRFSIGSKVHIACSIFSKGISIYDIVGSGSGRCSGLESSKISVGICGSCKLVELDISSSSIRLNFIYWSKIFIFQIFYVWEFLHLCIKTCCICGLLELGETLCCRGIRSLWNFQTWSDWVFSKACGLSIVVHECIHLAKIYNKLINYLIINKA